MIVTAKRRHRPAQLLLLSNVFLTARNCRGDVVEVVSWHNLVVDVGLNLARDLFGGNGFAPSHIAVGTGTTAPAAGNTALEAEVFRRAIDRRVPGTKKVTLEIVIDFAEANGNTITEVGVFEASSLVARAVDSPGIAKNASIQLTVAHEINFATP